MSETTTRRVEATAEIIEHVVELVDHFDGERVRSIPELADITVAGLRKLRDEGFSNHEFLGLAAAVVMLYRELLLVAEAAQAKEAS